MKNLVRKLPIKIVCFIFCVLFLFTTVISVLGTIFIAFEGFYTHSEEDILWDAVHREATNAATTITFSAASGKDYHVDEIFAKDKTNLRYAVFDSSNNLVMANCDGNGNWEYYFSFERIKEELREGLELDEALTNGFKRGLAPIIDGNVTVVIVSVILMLVFGPTNILSAIFGASTTGSIYSFGYTLLVGTIFNLIMGVLASKSMIKSISQFKFLRNPWLYGGKKNA